MMLIVRSHCIGKSLCQFNIQMSDDMNSYCTNDNDDNSEESLKFKYVDINKNIDNTFIQDSCVVQIQKSIIVSDSDDDYLTNLSTLKPR